MARRLPPPPGAPAAPSGAGLPASRHPPGVGHREVARGPPGGFADPLPPRRGAAHQRAPRGPRRPGGAGARGASVRRRGHGGERSIRSPVRRAPPLPGDRAPEGPGARVRLRDRPPPRGHGDRCRGRPPRRTPIGAEGPAGRPRGHGSVKIAILCHYFWPETSAPSARLLELGRAWVAEGHEVSVVTNFPHHPTGVIPESYRGKRFLIERAEGIRVIRCRTYATPNRGFLRKALGPLVFMVQAVVQGAPALGHVDVLVASSPTLFAVVAAAVISRRLGVPFVFEVRDLWPAIFLDPGVIRNRLAIWCLERLELALYRRSGAVVTVTRAFARDIEGRGIAPAPPDPGLRARLGLGGKFVVLYCGAHGSSHALERILEVARLQSDDPRIHFLFVGEGAEKDALLARAGSLGLGNVTFRPGVPREEVPALYRSADVCLVPLRDVPLSRSFVPSKMFEILACGRPIVAAVAGEAAEILEASGAAIVVPPEDVGSLSRAVARLAGDPSLRAELAARGRAFAAAHYDRRSLAARYLRILEHVREGRAAAPARTL